MEVSGECTFGAISGDVNITDAGVGVRETRKLGNEWLRNDFRVDLLDKVTLGVACSLDVSLSKPGTRSHIVDVLSNVRRYVIGFSRDIMRSRGVLPDVELSNEQVFDLSGCSVELDPL